MRIAVIGLGDIAQKAYLPVLIEKEGIDLILCTRNKETLDRLAAKYHIEEKFQTVDQLFSQNIDAAFVSTATEAHAEIAEKLLRNGISVYIDKPVSLDFEESERIAALAKESGKTAMVGFNRRFIPRIRELREKDKANIILMQKNRFAAPQPVRQFIVEDFIHVVDTLRFLMDTDVKDIKVEHLRVGEMLEHVVIQLIGDGCTAVGIMNRNTGVTEETIEYMTNRDKYVINSLVETTHFHDKEINVTKFGDWDPTLYKRGFYQLVDHFIDSVRHNRQPDPSIEDSLITHRICEQIVEKIEENL